MRRNVAEENRWRSRVTLTVLSLLSLAALVLYFFRSIGIVIAIVSAIIIVAMEIAVMHHVTRQLPFAHIDNFRSGEASDASRLERRARVSKSALKERAYSQHLMLQELRLMIIDRVCATRMIRRRELAEIAKKEGPELFGSALLYRVYTDEVLPKQSNRMRALPSEEFVEVFNNIVSDMRRRN